MKVLLSKAAGLTALCAILVALFYSGAAAETTYECKNATCAGSGSCSGDMFQRNTCVVQCFRKIGGDGQIEPSGNATCTRIQPPPQGGGGGGGGFEGGGGGWGGGGWGGGYCYENWMWDAGCQGPDDAYEPIHMAYAW